MKKNSFVEGTIIATLAIVLVKILGMLYVIPFYKIVGSNGAALYSYAYNIYLIFLGISSVGLPNAVSKIISEYNALEAYDAKERAYKIAIKIISFISIVAFLVLFVFAEEIGKFIIGDLTGGNTFKDVAFVIRCVAPAVLVIPFLSVTKGYLQGHKYVSPSSISQVIEQVVRIFVILIGSYITLNVLNKSLSASVGIACTGAFFGGLCAYLYLKHVINKNQDKLFKASDKKDLINNKEILKKIIKYAIPFIIINIVTNIYNFTDQILVLRTISKMGFSAKEVEFIASSISTWSPKICMIINSMAMGMTISLIPTIVSAYTKGDKGEVTDKVNRSISMVFYISLPLAIGLSILSKEVWFIFYDDNINGSLILMMAVYSALLANVYMIISTILQGLNKFKAVYLVSITGFVLNALLDVPVMYIFNALSLPPFLGSIAASIIGFGVSVYIGIYLLKKDGINFRKAFRYSFRALLCGVVMLLILSLVNALIPFNTESTLGILVKIITNTFIGGIIYLTLSIKLNLLNDIFGKEMINRILKKLTLGKFKG